MGIPYRIVIENDYVPRIKELEEKKVLPIETNNWVCKKEELENLIQTGCELIELIKRSLHINQ